MAGLPEYRIFIDPKNEKLLQQEIWSDRYVQANMRYGGKTTPIRIRYRGGHTREYPKKSYEIRTPSIIFHLNAEYDDPSLIRNALSFHLFNSIGVPSPQTRHCLLTINGKPAGVYLQIEAVQPSFFRRRGIPVRSIIYAVNDNADFSDQKPPDKSLFSGYHLIQGGERARTKLMKFISTLQTLKGEELRSFLQARLHIDNYLRWLCGAVLTGNYDGFKQNYTLFEYGGTRLYGMIPWDYEGTWGRNCYGKSVSPGLVRIEGYNKLTEQVLSCRVYRQQYKRRLTKLLDTTFTAERLLPVVQRMQGHIAEEVSRDSGLRWNSRMFEKEEQTIKRYIEQRHRYLTGKLKTLDS